MQRMFGLPVGSLAVALIAIVGLTIAVVVLATSNTTTPAAHHTTPATSAATQREDQLNWSYFYPGHY